MFLDKIQNQLDILFSGTSAQISHEAGTVQNSQSGVEIRVSTSQTGDKGEGQTVSFAVCVFKIKSYISGKGLGEFQTEMERGRGLGGEAR